MASTSSGVNFVANLYKMIDNVLIDEMGKRQRGGGRVKERGERERERKRERERERERERNTIPCQQSLTDAAHVAR